MKKYAAIETTTVRRPSYWISFSVVDNGRRVSSAYQNENPAPSAEPTHALHECDTLDGTVPSVQKQAARRELVHTYARMPPKAPANEAALKKRATR